MVEQFYREPSALSARFMNILWPLISRETVNHRRLPKEKKKKVKAVREKAPTKKSKKDYTPSYDLFSEEAEREATHEG